MHTFSRYATLTTANNFVLVRGGEILCKVESLVMILLFASLASLSTPYSGGLTIILCSSLTDNRNKKFGTNCGYT